MLRVNNKMKIRILSFTILVGTFLSANPNSENLPTPIPIDFGENTGMRSDSTICESCIIPYEADVMGASCCDEATQFNSDFTCEVLETTYLWNCSGCTCTEDDDNWATDFGCMDELACNFNLNAIWDDDSCSFTDGICQYCENGEAVDNDDDGDNVCNEDEIVGCQDEIACDFNPEATDPDECTYQLSYCEDIDGDGLGAGDSWEYCLEDVPDSWVNDCTDSDPNCATNDTDECDICSGDGAVYGNYENCCEENVDDCGVCNGTNASMDECGVCFGNNSTCMDCSGVPNGDAEQDECGICNGPGPIYDCGCSDAPAENYDCDGNCIAEIDCNSECGGGAVVDECGVCDGDGSSCTGSTVSLEIQNVDLDNGILDIYMVNSEEVGGFQFELLGISITGASGGTASQYFAIVNASSTSVLGFDIMGGTIPIGEGVLTQVSFTDYTGDEICFGEDTGSAGGTAISGVGGVYIPADWGPCFGGNETIPGCMDMDACNYNPDANEEDDCTYAEDNYDCEGNCMAEMDCNSECGGGAVVDECGVCDGDGSSCNEDECATGVCVNIENVNIDTGTLDIHMSNYSGCSYCADSIYNNNSQDWFYKKAYCELSYAGDTTWVSYDNLTEEECAQVPSFDGNGGWYFNGEIGGFQFELPGATITGASGGIAEGVGYTTMTTPSSVIGFSLTGSTISEGEGILTQVAFSATEDESICFGEDTGSAGNTAISDENGGYIEVNWGSCFGGDETIPGCMEMDACNYNPDANEEDDCTYAEENYDCDGNCIVEMDCNDECGGTAELDECGECGGDGSSCVSWTELTAAGGENHISLSWEPFESLRPSFMGRGCEDDPNICIWNSWYSDYDNQQDCEANGGIWGSYLEYFGTSCDEMVSDAGCDTPILYWMVSDLCPESCGVCLDGCTDLSACNFNPDATDDDGSCELPEENYDCDGNCAVEIDCNEECGGSAMEDECSECNGSGANVMCEDGSYVCDESECDTGGESTVSLVIQNVDLNAGTLDIYMVNSEEVGGFQMEITGITITDATAPDGFMVSTSSTTILAFSLTGATIPIGEGVLTQVSFSDYLGDEICFGEDTGSSGGTAISGASAEYIAADWGSCYGGEIIIGCMDMNGCNYNPEANTPDECTYAEENFDCDGNCIVELDCYGVCGGEFPPDFACFDGSIVCNPSDCGVEPITYNLYRDGELLMGWLMDANYVDSDLGYSESHCYTVTYNYGGGLESEHSNEACAETNPEPVIPGCMDENACNYNPDANEPDECSYAEENYDCDGNCIPGEDECGVCGGDGPEIECWDGEMVCSASDCTDEPDDSPFSFNQSSNQAFYHIFTAYDLDGNSLVAGEDWVGVFNGDVCVGAREWTNDISTDIPAMGDDGYWYSIGYLQEGDYPSFQIFDASENQYYAAQPSEEYAFSNNGTFSVESLSAGVNYNLSLNNHHNLVSFYALPEDMSIAGVTYDLGNNALSVIAEGSSAINLDGIWSGSLTEFSGEKGYWISIDNFPDNLSVIGFDMDPDRMYVLHEGPNLISFPDSGSADLSSAIPDNVEHLFTAIISEGISALNSDNGWAGSLTGFQGGTGYWVIVQEELTFSYNTEDLLARSVHSFSEMLPDQAGFTVSQSSRQAFYFVKNIKLDNGGVEDGDWILSYNNDVLAGIRQWKGKTNDIPAMGSASDLVTAGYFNVGDTPAFKLLKQSTGEIIALEGNIPSWSDNGIFNIGELSERQPIPELITLNKAYPNPFNPTTTIGFGLPDQSDIVIEIFNLHGKRVEILVDESLPAGYSSVVWNADKFSSGLYFVKLYAQSLNGIKYTRIQKLMLVK